MDRDLNCTTRQELLANFLASSFFAEDEATPVVEKLLRHPTNEEERALLLSYAREEDGHARILDRELARRGLPKGQPFWIQRIFRRMSARTSLLVQFYHVEIIAGCCATRRATSACTASCSRARSRGWGRSDG